MAEKIIRQNAADAAEDYSCIFGANKNLYRVKPSLQDGMKPGKRRMFWSWWINTGRPQLHNMKNQNKFKKVEAISALTMQFHPHGDGPSKQILGREGQGWNNNVMTIVPNGNFGSIQGARPAAGRYIDAKFSEYLIDCFFEDFDKYCVPMKPSYDGEDEEPEYLPAKYPHGLFNHQLSGIGYGSASNIPPFNVTEVLKATIKLIRDQKENILLIPDSPTGCEIIDEGLFRQINEIGEGKFTLRAKAEIDYVNNIIHIKSLPINSSSSGVIQSIVELKKKKDFSEILEIQDDTKKGTVNMRLCLSSDVNPDKVLEKLYKKKTLLKMSYPVNLSFIDNYKEDTYSTKRFLLDWIDYRRDAIRAMWNNDLIQTLEKQHITEAMIFICKGDNAENLIKLSKTASGRRNACDMLVNKFDLTSLQANSVLDMKFYNLNKDYREKLINQLNELTESVEKLEYNLEHDEEIDLCIIKQLEEGIKKYGRPRMSPIVKERDNKVEENIPDTNHLIGISESGYIKKIGEENSSIGSVGKTNGNLTACRVNNRESILVVDSSGIVCKIPVSSVPDMKFDDIGVEISRYFSTTGSIKAILRLPSINMLSNVKEDVCILLVTKFGYAKRVSLTEFKQITSIRSAITLSDDDEVVSANFCMDNSTKDIVIITNLGRGIRLPIDEVKIYGRNAKGVIQIGLNKEEYVVSSSKLNAKKKILFYVTSAGRVKLTQERYFPAMKRKDEPLQLISLEGTETLVGVASVTRKDSVMVYRKHNEPVLIDLEDLPMSTRIAKGDKKIKTPKGDFVVAFKVFEK